MVLLFFSLKGRHKSRDQRLLLSAKITRHSITNFATLLLHDEGPVADDFELARKRRSSTFSLQC